LKKSSFTRILMINLYKQLYLQGYLTCQLPINQAVEKEAENMVSAKEWLPKTVEKLLIVDALKVENALPFRFL